MSLLICDTENYHICTLAILYGEKTVKYIRRQRPYDVCVPAWGAQEGVDCQQIGS